MMGKRTIIPLSLFLLLGPSSSLAQQDETATRATPYRIAIFPAGGCFVSTMGYAGDCGTVGKEETARLLQAHIQRDNALVLTYSYYDDVLNEPRIRKPDRLWVGGAVQKKPSLELVYQMGRERDVDGVIMYWGSGRTGVFGSDAPAPIDFYLIDIERRQVYRAKGTTKKSSVRKLTKRVLADFMRGRPQVVLAQATPTPKRAATMPQPAPVTQQAAPTQQRIASPAVPATGPRQTVTVPTGTQVFMELEDRVSSGGKEYRQSKVGDVVRAHVWRDVVVDGRTVIEAGTPIVARVGHVQKAKIAGRPGKVRVDAISVNGVDGQAISLTGGYDGSGKSRAGSTIALAVLVSWLIVFMKGKQAILDPGAIFDAAVLQQAQVAVYGPPAPRPAPDPNPPLSVEILYDHIDPGKKLKELPIRLRGCGAPLASASVVTINDSTITPISVDLEAGQPDGSCTHSDGTVKMKALLQYFTKGMNRFEVEAGGARKQVLLELEL